MGKFARGSSMPLKFLTGFLLIILLVAELVDGYTDIADYIVPFFVLLMGFDIYFLYKNGLSSPHLVEKHFKMNKAEISKMAMNGFFMVLILGSFVLGLFEIHPSLTKMLYKMGMIVWSGAFLGISFFSVKKEFKLSKLIFCQMALIFFVSSCIFF